MTYQEQSPLDDPAVASTCHALYKVIQEIKATWYVEPTKIKIPEGLLPEKLTNVVGPLTIYGVAIYLDPELRPATARVLMPRRSPHEYGWGGWQTFDLALEDA